MRLITTSDPAYPDELELRFRVLREPLGLARTDVLSPFERESLHLVAEQGPQVLGCVLFHAEGATEGRLFQMAILPDAQRLGLGRRLVATLEQELQRRGFEQVYLHARALAVGFYERVGYSPYGEPFIEVGLQHRLMRKILNAGAA